MTTLDEKLERAGKKIILPALPAPMPIKEAIKTLQMIEKEEETVIMVQEIVNAFPLEGAYAFVRALERIHGWATPLPGGFFLAPPATITLEIGFKSYAQVIWGRFAVPNIEGELSTGTADHEGRTVFCISGNIKRKNMPELKVVADLTRKIAEEESIYRGKAIRLRTDDSGGIEYDNGPGFIDLSGVRESEMVFNPDTMEQIRTNVFTPIEHTATCRAEGVPLKRAVLLEGDYGTGKTLVAKVTSKKAVNRAWTYIMLDNVAAIAEALRFARLYQPAIVFAEDIDREVSGEERTTEIDKVLNTIDGVESKGTEIMCILTSNHVEEINRAMLRPGRLDAVIHIDPPDAEAAERLVRIYGRTTVDPDEDLAEVGQTLAGHIPAAIREAVERAKLYAIASSDGGSVKIRAHDLLMSAKQMRQHLELLKGRDVEPNKAEILVAALGDLMSRALHSVASADQLAEVGNMVRVTGSNAAAANSKTSNLARAIGQLSGTAAATYQKAETIEKRTEHIDIKADQILSEVS